MFLVWFTHFHLLFCFILFLFLSFSFQDVEDIGVALFSRKWKKEWVLAICGDYEEATTRAEERSLLSFLICVMDEIQCIRHL